MLKQILTCFFVCAVLQQTVFGQTTTNLAPRKLVPGVITTIRDANIDDATLEETRDFTELLARVAPADWTPNSNPKTETLLEKAKSISFQREIWSLEFGFKPLRVINVGGKPVWYLVYFVRNTGEVRYPEAKVEKISIKSKSKPIRFIPSFVLAAHDLRKTYRDSVRPDLVSQIAFKERVTRGVLHDSSSIAQMEIPVSTADADRRVWGVATFDNVDSRADLISIFVSGLTNAYQWQPPKDGYQGNGNREQDRVLSKALQLNFWRGGDDVDLNDSEFIYGLPLYPDEPARQADVFKAYGIDRAHRYRWVYR